MNFICQNYQIKLHGKALFKPFDLSVSPGEIGAITGPSGSGKSTILMDISGVLLPEFTSSGSLLLNGSSLKNIPVEQRNIGILFQDDLLFPHLSVEQNLIFGLPKKYNLNEKKQRIEASLVESGLSGFQSRDIATLSGGQRARISLIRILLSEPKLILLDEPFSKLDSERRGQFRQWVFSQIKEQNIPAIIVSHDKEDIPNLNKAVVLESVDVG